MPLSIALFDKLKDSSVEAFEPSIATLMSSTVLPTVRNSLPEVILPQTEKKLYAGASLKDVAPGINLYSLFCL